MNNTEARSHFDRYINDIRQHALLSREDEVSIASDIKEKKAHREKLKQTAPEDDSKIFKLDLEIQRLSHKMVQANYRLVVSVAKKYKNPYVDLEDLVEEGNLGLLRAVQLFDVDKGYRFSTFAIWWIRQSILKALRNQGSPVKLPIYVEKDRKMFDEASKRYKEKHGVVPTIEELESFTDLKAKKLRLLANLPEGYVSLNTPMAGTMTEMGECLPEKSDRFDPLKKSMDQSLRDELACLMKGLNLREKMVLKLRFGLDGVRPHRLTEIGDQMNITRERVRQILGDAFLRMKSSRSGEAMAAYLREQGKS